MATPDLIKHLLNGTQKPKNALDAARAKREAEIDEAAEREGMMMLRGSRRIRRQP